MTTQTVPGSLVATTDAESLAREAASRMRKFVRDTLRDQPFANVAISGGSTPKRAYELFAEEEGVEFDRIRVFYVDERAVPPESERSNHRMFEEAFVKRVGSRAPQVFRMRGEAEGSVAASEYETLLREHVPVGPTGTCRFDVVILGVGADGHTASLFPNEPTVRLRDAWVAAVPASDAHEARITLTAPVLEAAAQLLILAQGASKTPALERVWNVRGSLDETPARVVWQAAGHVTWIVDREAAGM